MIDGPQTGFALRALQDQRAFGCAAQHDVFAQVVAVSDVAVSTED